jgi:hypothetical protein
MNCQEFQEALPHIILESGGNAEEETHLRSCPACAILVQDLRYIADQAKLLLPLHDPSPRVWSNIERSLRNEGLIREGRMSLMGQLTSTPQMTFPSQSKSWTPLGWAITLAAVIVSAVMLVNYHPVSPAGQEVLPSPAVSSFEGTDEQLMGQVAQQPPAVRSAYEDSLKSVNTYIADAKRAVDDNPSDPAAQQHLMDAYDQKAMLYEMGTVRSLQ